MLVLPRGPRHDGGAWRKKKKTTTSKEEEDDELGLGLGGRREAEEQRYDYDRPYPAIPPGRINLDVAWVREELVSSSVAIALHLQSSHHPLPLLLHCRHSTAPQASK